MNFLRPKEFKPYQGNPLSAAEFLIHMKDTDNAKKVLDILKPYTENIQQWDAIGKLYSEIREFQDSLDMALKIYPLLDDPKSKWDCRTNIIRAYLGLNEPNKALHYVQMNEVINPNDHANRMDRAYCHFLLNEKDKGEVILRKILEEPHDEDIDMRVRFNLGSYDLHNGNFKEGIKHVLLDGRKLNIWENFSFDETRYWSGGAQPGKTIMLAAEGGIGDEFISVRFMKHFKDLGMHPVWFTAQKKVAAVLKRNGFEVIEDPKQFKDDWLWTYSMATPAYLDLDTKDLWYGSYLTPQRKKEPLPGKKKIGIKTMGNPKYDQDLNRTVPFNDLIDSIPEDYTIYSFHIDEDFNHPRVTNLKGMINDWEDTLDYLDQMDVVVSSCTSLAHASSIIDKKTYIFVPILNYYTWGLPGVHSPWYSDNVYLVRQQEHNNWKPSFEELKGLL